MHRTDFEFNNTCIGCSVSVGAFFDELAPAVSELIHGRKSLILTDSNVSALYFDNVTDSLRDAGAEMHSYIIPAGENSKTYTVLNSVLEYLIKNSFGRNDLIINLGGGVVSDLGGFAASVYMRGINYINIPTTLLSMVDSSFGGKTGIDFCGIKNVVGAFRHPLLIADAVSFLDTLTERELHSGYGEIIKYHLLTGMDIFAPVSNETAERFILNSIEAKYAFVCDDVFDSGKRKLLNLGHTFGHAFEAASDFELSHGEAVALGLYSEAVFAEKAGLIPTATSKTIRDAIGGFGLSVDFARYAKGAAQFLPHDKKRSGSLIDLPLIEEPGKPFLAKIDLDDAILFLDSF